MSKPPTNAERLYAWFETIAADGVVRGQSQMVIAEMLNVSQRRASDAVRTLIYNGCVTMERDLEHGWGISTYTLISAPVSRQQAPHDPEIIKIIGERFTAGDSCRAIGEMVGLSRRMVYDIAISHRFTSPRRKRRNNVQSSIAHRVDRRHRDEDEPEVYVPTRITGIVPMSMQDIRYWMAQHGVPVTMDDDADLAAVNAKRDQEILPRFNRVEAGRFRPLPAAFIGGREAA